MSLGAGTDTVRIVGSAGDADIPSLSGVEILELKNNTAGADVSGVSDLETLKLDDSDDALIYTIANGQAVSVANMANGEAIDFAGNTVAALGLTVSGLGTAAGTGVTVDLTSTAQTSVDLSSTGSAANNIASLANTGGKLATINVAGGQALDLNATVATITTLDASAMTAGGVTADLGASTKNFTVTGSGFNDTLTVDAAVNVTVDAGAGDDKVVLAGTLTKDDSVEGGAGIDAISVTDAEAAATAADPAVLAVVTGFEELTISDGLDTNQDLTKLGLNTLNLETALHDSANTITVASGDTINFDVQAAITADVDNSANLQTVAVKGASGAGANSDVLNIGFSADFDEAAAHVLTNAVSVDFVETVNVTSSATDRAGNADGTIDNGSYVLDLQDAERVETLTINATGAAMAVTDSASTFTALNTVNASESTAGVTISLDNATQGVVFTGGSGNDVVDASAFADSLTGGEGDNTFTFTAGDSTEANMDVINDFTISDGTSDNDTLDLNGTTNALNKTGVDVSGADADSAATDIKAKIVDGILTFSGGDVAALDTLAEYIDAAESAGVMTSTSVGTLEFQTAAFEFDGDTYVIQRTETGATDDIFATTDVVMLAGVTGVDTTAGVDTLVIA